MSLPHSLVVIIGDRVKAALGIKEEEVIASAAEIAVTVDQAIALPLR